MSDDYENILKEVDNYQQTVGVIIAFSHLLKYESGYLSIIGKKLKTTKNNKISPSNIVSPDIVSKNDLIGLITEVKKNLPTNKDYWNDDINQIEKYDDDLTGWTGEEGSVDNHDIVILIHMVRSNQLKDYIRSLIKEGKIKFDKNLSIVEFVRNVERNTFFSIKKVFGNILDEKIDKKLDNCISVNFKHILKDLGKIKFYDSEPPIEYIMSILWNEYISSIPSDDQRRTYAMTNKTIEIEVNSNKAHEYLVDFTGPSQNHELQSQIPKKKWIIKAFDAFVQIKYAKKIDKEKYLVKFRRHGNMDDTVRHFAEKLSKGTQRSLTDFKDKSDN